MTELFLDAINALIALFVLYLGIRIIITMRFTLQRRFVYLFITAAVLFAIQEMLALIAEATNQSENLGLVREIIESAFIICLAYSMYMVIRSERQEISVLRQSAELDPLTQLYNISYFHRAAARKLEQAKKYNLPLALAMLDIDDFKEYNDLFGHEAGNNALQFVAQTLQETIRLDDLVARYGGEEFVVLMVINPPSATITVERIRSAIESRCSPDLNTSLRRQITVSIGFATIMPITGGLKELIEKADKALYCAKKSGKNRVSSSPC